MTRVFSVPLGIAVALTIVFAFNAQPVSAQCNHCGPAEECFDYHWDNCGIGGPGLEWSGSCASGCDTQDCANHSPGGCFAALGFDSAVKLAATGESELLAKAAMAGEVDFDPERGVIYIRSRSSDAVLGQVPLTEYRAMQLAAAIQTRRNALLALLDQ
jgi:hypothetical protein